MSWLIGEIKKLSPNLFEHIHTTVQKATVCSIKEMSVVCTICPHGIVNAYHKTALTQYGHQGKLCLSLIFPTMNITG